jgi:hypothetical protein
MGRGVSGDGVTTGVHPNSPWVRSASVLHPEKPNKPCAVQYKNATPTSPWAVAPNRKVPPPALPPLCGSHAHPLARDMLSLALCLAQRVCAHTSSSAPAPRWWSQTWRAWRCATSPFSFGRITAVRIFPLVPLCPLSLLFPKYFDFSLSKNTGGMLFK